MKTRWLLVCALGFATWGLAAHADAPAAGSGELWEVSSHISMRGFSIPAQTHRVCQAPGAQEPPGASGQPGCTTHDFRVVGNKTSWRVQCAGPPPMSGSGELTRTGPAAYTGRILFSSPDGEMTMNLSGRRVGACTPGR